MDREYDSDMENRRRTQILHKVPQELQDKDDYECMEDSESSLSLSTMENSLTNEENTQQDETVLGSELLNQSVCTQLRGMTPEKISQLLNKLELDDGEIQEDNQTDENCPENQPPKKGKLIKGKVEPKKTKGKKVTNELEHDDKEPTATKFVASTKETTKTEKPKRGHKEVLNADSLDCKDSNNVIVNPTSIDSVPSGDLNGKKPNKSKGKKANELQHDDKKEHFPTKVEPHKEKNSKTNKPNRGKKEATGGDSSTSKDLNKDTVNSICTDSVPPEVVSDKKPNKSKKAGNGKDKECGEEKDNIENCNTKDKENSSKTKMLTETNKKKQEVSEATLKEKMTKSRKMTVSETDVPKDSKTTNPKAGLKPKPLNTNESETISTRTRGKKNPTGVKTDKELSKPTQRATLVEKKTVEKANKKENGGKQQVTENSENKENKAKNTKPKGKTEPTQKEKPTGIEKKTGVDEIVLKTRVTRKNK